MLRCLSCSPPIGGYLSLRRVFPSPLFNGNGHGRSAKKVAAIKGNVFAYGSLSNWQIVILIALPARGFLADRSVIYPARFLVSGRPEQAGLADILDGEHADELCVLGNRQCLKATLLQDAKTVLE